MPFLRRTCLLGALACLLVLSAPPVSAKELRLSYAEEMKPLLPLASPRFDRLQGVFLVSEADARRACPGASVRLVDGGQVRTLAMASDGRVEMPIDQALADRGAQLWLAKPDDAPDCRIFTNVTARLPVGQAWRYRDLSIFSAQLQAYLKHGAGLFSAFAPSLRGVLIRFEGNPVAEVVIHAAAGDIRLRSTDGELRLPIDARLADENPVVTLSAPALAVDGWLDE